jgi:hypothetical protein
MEILYLDEEARSFEFCCLDKLPEGDYFTIKNWRYSGMAQRRAEKPKKVKISPKQQELYNRLRSSK